MQHILDDIVKGARENGSGRSVTVQLAKEAGVQDALRTYLPSLKSIKKFVNDPHKMELAGIGLLAAPLAHDIVSDENSESHAMRTAKKITELVGLGVLGHSTLKEMH